MSYQVIARKYRPQRFADVVGQDHVTQTLANAIEQGRIAHAYLFCGPRGTGKTTLARIFAKCLNCEGGPRVEFAEDDLRCREIAEGRSMDVLEIDGASNNGVEQVRELRETVKYAPASSRFKIYIIDEVHMLTTAAFNALLKTLEEPPAHVKFLFATTDPEKVLPTILSRCQRFDLRRIPAALIVKHLAMIAGQEGVTIEDAALHAIARGADGGMRDAESTLDQLISFCGDQIAEKDVLSMFGLTAREDLLGLVDAILSGEAEQVLKRLETLARTGKDLGRLLADLVNHFRNLLVFQVSRGDLSLVEVSEAEGEALRGQSRRVGADGVGRILEVLSDAEGRLREAVSKKIMLEVALLRAVQARQAVNLDTVLQQLQLLRSEGLDGGTGPAAPTELKTEASARGPAEVGGGESGRSRASGLPAASSSGSKVAAEGDTKKQRTSEEEETGKGAGAPKPGVVAGDLAGLWSALLEGIRALSPFTHSYLSKGFPVSCDRGVLVVGFDPADASLATLVGTPKNQGLMVTRLKELGIADPQVKIIQTVAPAVAGAAGGGDGVVPKGDAGSTAIGAPASGGTGAGKGIEAAATAAGAAGSGASAEAAEPKRDRPKAEKLNPSDFKDDPLIKQALEIFKGRIIEVRKQG